MKLHAAITTWAAFLSIALALPDSAHAGFGRRSGGGNSSPSRSSSSSGGGSSSSGGFGRSGHSSSSWSSSDSSSSSSGSGYYPSRSRRSGHRYRAYPRTWGDPLWGYGFGYVPSYPVAPIIVDGQPAPLEVHPEPRTVGAALAGDLMFGGSGRPLLGLQLSIEGERFGFLAGYTAAFAPIDGGGWDTLHLALGHLTYAFVATERFRLRAEAGVHIAGAPLVTFIAPGAGLSAVLALAGPLGIEARLFGNIWPYTQIDARAGLNVSFGSAGLGAGIRALYLNDNGVLGAVNAGDTSDSFLGPYVTLALAL
jgi:hypothetical protein